MGNMFPTRYFSFLEAWLQPISAQKGSWQCSCIHIFTRRRNRLGWHSPLWDATIPVDCPPGHSVGKQGIGCAHVCALLKWLVWQHVGWEGLWEGEEELLDLCHHNSPWSYVMLSWQSGQAGRATWTSMSYQGTQHRLFSSLGWFILVPHTTVSSDLLSFPFTCCDCVTRPACAGWGNNTGLCTRTSLFGSQNPCHLTQPQVKRQVLIPYHVQPPQACPKGLAMGSEGGCKQSCAILVPSQELSLQCSLPWAECNWLLSLELSALSSDWHVPV